MEFVFASGSLFKKKREQAGIIHQIFPPNPFKWGIKSPHQHQHICKFLSWPPKNNRFFFFFIQTTEAPWVLRVGNYDPHYCEVWPFRDSIFKSLKYVEIYLYVLKPLTGISPFPFLLSGPFSFIFPNPLSTWRGVSWTVHHTFNRYSWILFCFALIPVKHHICWHSGHVFLFLKKMCLMLSIDVSIHTVLRPCETCTCH